MSHVFLNSHCVNCKHKIGKCDIQTRPCTSMHNNFCSRYHQYDTMANAEEIMDWHSAWNLIRTRNWEVELKPYTQQQIVA